MTINRMILMTLVVASLINTLFSSLSLAEDKGGDVADRGNDTRTQPREWTVQFSAGYLPAADFHGIPGDAAISDYRVKIARSMKIDERLTLTTGAGYGLKHIDASSGASLPRDLHALFVEAGANYRISDRAFASLKLSPGFYSDFEDIGGDDLRMPALALGGYGFDNGITVVGGLLYRFGSPAGQLIPALGLTYQPNRSWRFDLILPRPAVTYVASNQLQLFVAGDFASDEYELHGQSFDASAIRYSDYKVMAGVGFSPTPAVKFTTSVGYAFERSFEFYDSLRPDLQLDNVPFFKVTLDVGW